MASTPQASPSFCIFCYRTIQLSAKSSSSPEKIKRFHEFLRRFTGKEIDLSRNSKFNKKLTCGSFKTCEECDSTITSFCELYHKFKCLELQLDLKLDKLVNVIQLSSKIPTSSTNVNQALQLTYQDDTKTIVETRNEIKAIRDVVTKAGLHRLSISLPRILLERQKIPTSDEHNGSFIDMKLFPEDLIDDHVSNQSCDSPDDDPLTCENDDIGEIYEEDCVTLDITTIEKDHFSQLKQSDPAIPIPENYNSLSVPKSREIPSSSSSTNISSERNYATCQICQRQVICSRQAQHYKIYHDLRQLLEGEDVEKCTQDGCGAYFLKHHQLREHRKLQHVELGNVSMTTINGEQYFQCKTCKTPFDDMVYLRRHLYKSACQQTDSEQGSQFVKCLDCKKKFERKEDLWVHQNQAHSSGKHNVCPKCGKRFDKTSSYKIHMEYHKGPAHWTWECSECKKKFANKNQLKRHAKSHLKGQESSSSNTKRKAGDHTNINGVATSYPEKITGAATDFMEISNEEGSSWDFPAEGIKQEQDPLEILADEESIMSY